MIDQHIKLPCGADLIVSQAEPGQYLLMHLVSDQPMDKFVRVDRRLEESGWKTKITVGIDPDNLPALRGILEEAQVKKPKWTRILEILREP